MAAKKQTRQEQQAEQEQGKDWMQAAEEAPDRPEIYPKLGFGGDKTATGSYVVEFLDRTPHAIKFQDRTQEPVKRDAKGRGIEWPEVEGWAVGVIVHDGKGFDDAGKGERRSVILRKPSLNPENGKPVYHSLTYGVLRLAKRHKTLLGRRAEISTRLYDHPQYGETRTYDVFDLEPEQAAEP